MNTLPERNAAAVMSPSGPSVAYARKQSRLERACELAREIEELLQEREGEGSAYGWHLAQAMARSLIDQLEELARS